MGIPHEPLGTPPPASNHEAGSDSLASINRCALLIVEDEPSLQKTLIAIFRDEFEVTIAGSGEEALEAIARREVHLVLTDHRLPGMSGVHLLEWVRQNRPQTVRLLMSGHAELKDAVEAVNRGQIYRYLVKPWRVDELRQSVRDAARVYTLEQNNTRLMIQLRQLNEELEKRVHQRTLELEEANRQLQQKNAMLERLALTDELTGLPNRRAIEQMLQAEVRRRNRYPSTLAVGLIDADHFKLINTRFLYPGGDQALIALSRMLTASLRAVDSVARIGGEEFLLVVPECHHEGAHIVAERIRQTVEQTPVYYKGQEIRLTVSVGFAVALEGMLVQVDQLLHQAATALSEAKANGRNCCVVRALRGSDPNILTVPAAAARDAQSSP